jgi:hypothetical protein
MIKQNGPALELMLGTSSSVVALAKKMIKPETKTVTRSISVPQTKVVKQQSQAQSTTSANIKDADTQPIRPQSPFPKIPD